MLEANQSSVGIWLGPTVAAIGSFATATIGFLLVRSSDAKKDERTFQREKHARDEARKDKIIERRNEIQRQSLVELQEVTQKFLRNYGEMLHHDMMQERKTGAWLRTLYPEDMNTAAVELGSRLLAVCVRVRDERVRELAQQISSEADKVVFSKSEDESRRWLVKASLNFGEMNKRIWEVLKSLDDVELSN